MELQITTAGYQKIHTQRVWFGTIITQESGTWRHIMRDCAHQGNVFSR
jgi:hypothetical protein